MIKKLLFLLLFSNFSTLYAQTIKTDVLVVGGSPSGVAAAIQCARSKAKTVLVTDSILWEFSDEKVKILPGENIPSGIWGEFEKHLMDFNGSTGPNASHPFPALQKVVARSILQKMMDTVKNLTVDLSTTVTTVKKDGDHWVVKLSNCGKDMEIKARVIIDATKDGRVAGNAGATFKTSLISREFNYQSTLYRTGIATGNEWPTDNTVHSLWSIPMYTLMTEGANNLLVTEGILAVKSLEFLPVELEIGQGAGTIAAYCAFFKTTTQNLNVRIIQGELLDFKGYLLPLTDIKAGDPDWRAIQQVCATGLLKGEKPTENSNLFVFMPDAPVTTAEIEPALTEIYTRAFIWFKNDKPGERFTIGNTLSFISDYTLTDPVILKGTIQKAWKTQYKFKLDFDLNRQITRREFAVLANRYLNPFSRTVDLNGRLVN